jgi:hypothetical protein
MSCSNARFKNTFANSVTSQMSEGFGGDFTSANRLAGHWKDDGDDDDEGGGGDEGNEKSPWLQTSTSQL